MASTSISPIMTNIPQPVKFTAQQRQFVSPQPPMTLPEPMGLPEDTILNNLKKALDQIGKPKHQDLKDVKLKMYG